MNAGSLPPGGWAAVRVEDTHGTVPSVVVRCVFCDRPLRWVHVLAHAHYPGQVAAGRCCAVRVCSAYDAADAERRFRNRLARRARFVDPRGWTTSRSNPSNVWRVVEFTGKVRLRVVLVTDRDGRHGVTVFDLSVGGGSVTFPWRYRGRAAAAGAAFDAIEEVRYDTSVTS